MKKVCFLRPHLTAGIGPLSGNLAKNAELKILIYQKSLFDFRQFSRYNYACQVTNP